MANVRCHDKMYTRTESASNGGKQKQSATIVNMELQRRVILNSRT